MVLTVNHSALFLSKKFLLAGYAFLSLILLGGCVSSDHRDAQIDYHKKQLDFNQVGTPEYIIFNGRKVPCRIFKNIALANTVEIKLFIYAHIIQINLDIGLDYRNMEYRLVWEPDFDYIKEVLQRKYPGIKLVSGRRSCAAPGQKNSNDGTRKVADGLDYSNPYAAKHEYVLWQLGEMRLSDDGQEMEVHVTRFRSGLDASEDVYLFKKKGQYWFYDSCKNLWLS